MLINNYLLLTVAIGPLNSYASLNVIKSVPFPIFTHTHTLKKKIQRQGPMKNLKNITVESTFLQRPKNKDTFQTVHFLQILLDVTTHSMFIHDLTHRNKPCIVPSDHNELPRQPIFFSTGLRLHFHNLITPKSWSSVITFCCLIVWLNYHKVSLLFTWEYYNIQGQSFMSGV